MPRNAIRCWQSCLVSLAVLPESLLPVSLVFVLNMLNMSLSVNFLSLCSIFVVLILSTVMLSMSVKCCRCSVCASSLPCRRSCCRCRSSVCRCCAFFSRFSLPVSGFRQVATKRLVGRSSKYAYDTSRKISVLIVYNVHVFV